MGNKGSVDKNTDINVNIEGKVIDPRLYVLTVTGDFYFEKNGTIYVYESKEKNNFPSIHTIEKLFPETYEEIQKFIETGFGFFGYGGTCSFVDEPDIIFFHGIRKDKKFTTSNINKKEVFFCYKGKENTVISPFISKETKEYTEKMKDKYDKQNLSLNNQNSIKM
jgi:hypothetical protein